MEPGKYGKSGYSVERYHLLEEDALKFLDFIAVSHDYYSIISLFKNS